MVIIAAWWSMIVDADISRRSNGRESIETISGGAWFAYWRWQCENTSASTVSNSFALPKELEFLQKFSSSIIILVNMIRKSGKWKRRHRTAEFAAAQPNHNECVMRRATSSSRTTLHSPRSEILRDYPESPAYDRRFLMPPFRFPRCSQWNFPYRKPPYQWDPVHFETVSELRSPIPKRAPKCHIFFVTI